MKNYSNSESNVRDNFKNAKLLIVEDNADHSFIIQGALQRSIPEVKAIFVTNEEEALSYLNRCLTEEWEIPKLVLLDLYLPDRQSGWRVLAGIRDLPTALAKIPVVLFSHSSHHDDILESYRRGCSSYIAKPSLPTDWQDYFQVLRSYWWETVTLPRNGFAVF